MSRRYTETEDLEDHKLIDDGFMKRSTVANLGNPDYDVVISKNRDITFYSEEDQYDDFYDDTVDFEKLIEKYTSIFYKIKRYSQSMGYPFLNKASELEQLTDFFKMMDKL